MRKHIRKIFAISTVCALFLVGGVPIVLAQFTPFAPGFYDDPMLDLQLQRLNFNLEQIQSNQSFEQINRAEGQMLDGLFGAGIDAFYPLNEGKLRAGLEKHPECPAHSHVVTFFCACDSGYLSNSGVGSSKCDEKKDIVQATNNFLNELDNDLQKNIRTFGIGSYKECAVLNSTWQTTKKAYDDAVAAQQKASLNYRKDYQETLSILDGYLAQLNDSYTNQCTTKNNLALPSDVPDDAWYRDAVSTFVSIGEIKANELFRPSDRAQRGDLIWFLVDLYGGVSQGPPKKADFDDVPVDSQDFPYFEEAAKRGWIFGDDHCYGKHPCLMEPDAWLTREQAAGLIVGAMDLKLQGTAPVIKDLPHDTQFANDVKVAASRCIIKGDKRQRVRPLGYITRAEMAVMVWRAQQNLSFPNCSPSSGH